MIFDLLTSPQDPRGRGKKIAVARLKHVSKSHIKFGLISPDGLGGYSITDGQTDRQKRGNKYTVRGFDPHQ